MKAITGPNSQASNLATRMREAHGLARVLAVGINDYDKSSGFHPLRPCVNDAETVRSRFQDVEQLDGDPSFCVACTSKSQRPPTRGEIIRLLRILAQGADSGSRIIFYYSGHGHRLPSSGDSSGELYLVPQDAYAFDDPKGFVAFSEVLEILEQSEAKQRLIILDACLSGPDLKKLKAPLDNVSYKFLQEYLDQTSGSAVLSSCGIDEASTTQSPNPSLSLFTHYFCEALLGNKDALDNGRLTVHFRELRTKTRGQPSLPGLQRWTQRTPRLRPSLAARATMIARWLIPPKIVPLPETGSLGIRSVVLRPNPTSLRRCRGTTARKPSNLLWRWKRI